MRWAWASAWCALAVAGCGGWAVQKNEILAREQGPLVPVDAIVVPGCPARPDGAPSTCITRRVSVAVSAFRAGLAPRIVFSGAAVHTPAVEAEVMALEARRLGVPDQAILLEERARHTQQNLRYAARMLRPHGWSHVLVVTDPFQMPLAISIARLAGLEPLALPTVPDLPPDLLREEVPLDAWEPLRRIAWF